MSIKPKKRLVGEKPEALAVPQAITLPKTGWADWRSVLDPIGTMFRQHL